MQLISVSISICCLLFLFVVSIIYFFKKKVRSTETKIYSCLLISNVVLLVVDILGFFIYNLQSTSMLLKITISKFYLCLYVLYGYIFVYYSTFVISQNNKTKLFFNLLTGIYIIYCVINLIVPIKLQEFGEMIKPVGIAVDIAYILSPIILFYLLLLLLFNIKKIIKKKEKRVIPVIVLLFISVTTAVIQFLNPGLVLIALTYSISTFIMYHTIENPDMKMIEQLNIAKAAAEKANRAKSDFLSSMSHEIRTPLNAIVGFSEMIEQENTIEGCKENAKDIVLASHTLLEIVNGILDISKIEANKMEIVNKEYSLLPELENLAKLMIPRIDEKPIELKTQFAPDIPKVMYGDIGKIKQVITNILTNACKYTERGEINFTVNCINEKDICSLVISVEDTGRGIKPDKINTLFTKFNRLEEDRNTTIEGTGLGLAITKSFVDMMGGKIIVQSKYGEGSKFTIYLKQKIVEKDLIVETETKEEELNLKGFKILVVDDNKLNLKVADKLLKKYSLSTVLIESGVECIDLIKKGEKYDLILMDDMMPRLRGPEVLTRLKQIPNFNIPTVILTANSTTGIKDSYLSEGFDDYLAKPIEKLELVRVLKKYLVKDNNTNEQSQNINNVEDIPVTIDENKIKVLIVDDNKINIKIASSMMNDYNFEIDEALSGAECIEKVKNKTYDLIFMDYMMPNMDGIETLNNLKALPNFKTSAIALTADATDGSREKFLNAGFDEYVAKPINKQILSDVINKMLNVKGNITDSKKDDTDTKNVEYLKEAGIDVDHGIELLGDMEMYDETLKLFYEGLNERFNRINSYKMNNDMPNYAVEVHGLKSDSKYLGFTKLAEISYEHELKSKANDIDYVNNNYNELVNETKKIFEIVKKYFS